MLGSRPVCPSAAPLRNLNPKMKNAARQGRHFQKEISMENIHSNNAALAQELKRGSNRSGEKLRSDCRAAMIWVEVLSAADAGPLLDSLFDLVINVLRHQCGVSYSDAELMLANARQECEYIIGQDIDGLVNVDAAIEAIVEYLADDGTEP